MKIFSESMDATKEQAEKVLVKATLSIDKNTLPENFNIDPKALHEEFEGSCIVVMTKKGTKQLFSLKGAASKNDHLNMLASYIRGVNLDTKDVMYLVSMLELSEVKNELRSWVR